LEELKKLNLKAQYLQKMINFLNQEDVSKEKPSHLSKMTTLSVFRSQRPQKEVRLLGDEKADALDGENIEDIEDFLDQEDGNEKKSSRLSGMTALNIFRSLELLEKIQLLNDERAIAMVIEDFSSTPHLSRASALSLIKKHCKENVAKYEKLAQEIFNLREISKKYKATYFAQQLILLDQYNLFEYKDLVLHVSAGTLLACQTILVKVGLLDNKSSLPLTQFSVDQLHIIPAVDFFEQAGLKYDANNVKVLIIDTNIKYFNNVFPKLNKKYRKEYQDNTERNQKQKTMDGSTQQGLEQKAMEELHIFHEATPPEIEARRQVPGVYRLFALQAYQILNNINPQLQPSDPLKDMRLLKIKKLAFLDELELFLQKPDLKCQDIYSLFEKIRAPKREYQFIHQQKHSWCDSVLLLFKRRANGEQWFWHTATYQEAVKSLKKAYLEKKKNEPAPTNEAQKQIIEKRDKDLLDYVRGNASFHWSETESRKSLRLGRSGA